MTVRKRRRARRQFGPLTEGQLVMVCRGAIFPWGDGMREFFTRGYKPDPARLAVLWEDVRDEILPSWIAKHPGTRPYAWWELESPEPFRRIYGGTWEPILWGFGGSRFLASVDDPHVGATIETEAAYLDRHGLLEDAEREALGDFPKTQSVGDIRRMGSFDRVEL